MKIVLTVVVLIFATISLIIIWHPTLFYERPTTPAHIFAKCIPPNIKMGMTKAEILALCGPPDSIRHQVLNGGEVDKEQWAYSKDGVYAYLRNGILDMLQYAENGDRFEWHY